MLKKFLRHVNADIRYRKFIAAVLVGYDFAASLTKIDARNSLYLKAFDSRLFSVGLIDGSITQNHAMTRIVCQCKSHLVVLCLMAVDFQHIINRGEQLMAG